MKLIKVFKNGIFDENPILRLVLGTCPTLAVTTSAINGIGMGVSTTAVLVGSNLFVSLLRKFIPAKVRIPAYITIIAGFVSIVEMLLKAYLPAVDKALGIYIPLIVVNCILLARAEAFASKNNAAASAVDGLGMGAGFTLALLLIGSIREILGNGSIFGWGLSGETANPALAMILPPGGFLVFGIVMAAVKRFSSVKTKAPGCTGCDMNCKGDRQEQGGTYI